MFAGIDCARDWPPPGMTSARWLTVPAVSVPLRALTATQDGVYFEPLLTPTAPVGGDPIAHVISWHGRLLLEDGHHRAVRAAIAGRRAIRARVLEVGS